jgi:hypothetical protein
MSRLEDLLEEALQRSSNGADGPSREDAISALRKGRSRRRRRYIATGVAAVLLGAAVVAPVVWLSPLGSPDKPQATPTPASSPSANDLSPPPGGPEFRPPTHREGHMTVMPLTFPDGSTAELVYPSELELERSALVPAVYIEGGPRSCGPNVITSRSNLAGDVYEGDRPIATFESARGEPVGLWRAKQWSEPYTWLVIPIDAWVLAVTCYPEERYEPSGPTGFVRLPPFRDEEVRLWASAVDGRETAEGFLVMSPQAPLRLGRWAHNSGPTLRFGEDTGQLQVLEIGLEGCDPSTGSDRSGRDGVVQWCVPPGIHFYAQGEEGFLDELAAGLLVRGFEGSDPNGG